MGTRLIFRDLMVVTDDVSCACLSDCVCSEIVPGNSSIIKTVPETDTGGQVEGTVTRTGGPNPLLLKKEGMTCG